MARRAEVGDEVADQELLRVHPVPYAPGLRAVVEAKQPARAEEIAPAVPGALGEQPVGEAVRAQVLDDPVLHQPRPRAPFDLGAGAALHDGDVDSGP